MSIVIVCFFTFVIHLAESLAYCIRYAGLKTRQIAISMSFVTSTLLVSRLSNMFQAPLLGSMVDNTVRSGAQAALQHLEFDFRLIILAAACGTLTGMFLTPSFINIFKLAINKFLITGSIPKSFLQAFKPSNAVKIIRCFRLPSFSMLKGINFKRIPKTFLYMNLVVTAIYTIGVLCALFAGANLPHLRATAVQLSGIVNGIATILLTLIVDPEGARITDQAVHEKRPEQDVRTVVAGLLLTKFLGILILAQLLFWPGSSFIIKVTQWIAIHF